MYSEDIEEEAEEKKIYVVRAAILATAGTEEILNHTELPNMNSSRTWGGIQPIQSKHTCVVLKHTEIQAHFPKHGFS